MIEITLWVLAIIAIAIVALLLFASRQPDTFHVARSMDVEAPPEKVFGLINDLRAMNTWNPFALNAPDQKGTYSGPQAGPGAVYDFDGKRSGSGRIEIVNEAAARSVEMRLKMHRPIACDNRVMFTLAPVGDTTKVTWAMSGTNSLMGKVFSLIFCSDAMVSKSFDEGLTNLKRKAEAV